jgi:hypothetical protein
VSSDNALLQSAQLIHSDAARNNVTISKAEGFVDPHIGGSNSPGLSNHI